MKAKERNISYGKKRNRQRLESLHVNMVIIQHYICWPESTQGPQANHERRQKSLLSFKDEGQRNKRNKEEEDRPPFTVARRPDEEDH